MLQPKRIVFTLILMISFPVINAVLFTPALPSVANFFVISKHKAQLLMPCFLFGYALAQLVYAPIANYYGRKVALYVGIIIQIIASILCVASGWLHLFPLLMIARFFLAIGAGVGLKMTFTFVNEYYKPLEAIAYISYIMIGLAITPGFGIAIGGLLDSHFGWQSCFYACTFYGLLLLIFSKYLPETLKEKNKHAFKPNILTQSYCLQFNNTNLVSCALLMGCANAFVYVFSTVAPFLAKDLYGMSSFEYGFSNIIPPIGLAIGLLCSAKLCRLHKLTHIVFIGILLILIGVTFLAINLLLALSAIKALFAPMIIVYLGVGLILPNISAIGMGNVIDRAHGAAVFNFINISVSGCMIFFLSFIHLQRYSLPGLYIVICASMFFIFWRSLSVMPGHNLTTSA